MAGKSSKGALRLLELKGATYWFRREIPPACRPFEDGLRMWRRNLETGDIRVAKAMRDRLERETDQRWADMRAGRFVSPSASSPAQRGSLWRETLAELGYDPNRRSIDLSQAISWQELTPEEQAEIEDDPLQAALDVEELEREGLRGTSRLAYEDELKGRVPVDHYVDAYLIEVKLVAASKAERRGLVQRFAQWAAKEGVKLDGVNRRVAGKYVASLSALHPGTRAKHLMALRGYWGYLHKRGMIEGGDAKGAPWTEQEMPDRSGRVDRGAGEPERPFTGEEVRILLVSPWPDKMHSDHRAQVMDSLRISLLSGLRLGEVVNLRVSDVDDVSISVRAGKTAAAIRSVPLHPGLVEVMMRRTLESGLTTNR
jgi:hypothetical protein